MIRFAINLLTGFIIAMPLQAGDRLVILNPALVETAFALGLEKSIVGVVEYSDFPDSAKKLPRVGSYLQPQIEKIIELKPTSVWALREGVDSISEQLGRAHINTLFVSARKIGDYPNLLSELCQNVTQKNECHVKEQKLKAAWYQQWKKIPPPKRKGQVFIQVDHEPLIVAGGDTFLSDILERCGHKNVFASLTGYPRPHIESLHDRQVDAIVVLGRLAKGISESQITAFWKGLPMTQGSSTIFVPADELSRLGPRLPSAAIQLCNRLGDVIR